MGSARRRTTWVLATTLLLTVIAWTNLTGFGIGSAPLTYDDSALLRLVAATLGVLLAWLLVLMERPASLLGDATWALLSALGLWAVISALTSEHGPIVWLGQSERLEGVVTIVLYGVIFGAGLQVGRSANALRMVSLALLVGTSVLAFHGVLQMLSIDPSDLSLLGTSIDPRYPRASLGNTNFLAGLLVLALPVAIAWFLAAPKARPRRWAAAACMLLFGVVLLATRTQGAWFAVVIEAALAIAVVSVVKRPSQRKRAIALSISLAISGIAIILAATVLGPTLGATPWASGSARLQLVRIALASAAEDPLTGSGPDTYLAEFRQHRSPAYNKATSSRSTNNNAHSWFPQYASTLGFPGALLLAAAVLLGLWKARPHIPVQPTECDQEAPAATLSPSQILRTGVWLGLLGVAVHLQFNVAILAFTVPFWLLMGVLAAPRARELRLPSAAHLPAVVAVVVMLGIAAYGSVRLLAADAAYLRSRVAFTTQSHDRAIKLAEEASRLNPTSVKYARGAAQARMQLALVAAGAKGPAEATAEIQAAEASFARVTKRWPTDYPAHAWLAAMRARLGVMSGDAEVLKSAHDAAREAVPLDRVHWEVAGFASGDATPGAVNSAISVPGLP